MEAPDLTNAVWRRSSYSQPTQSDCVEIARTPQNLFIRDSKNPNGDALGFEVGEIGAFLSCVKQGRHDL